MEDKNLEVNQFLKTIAIIHIAIILGLLLFIMAIFFSSNTWEFIIDINIFIIVGITLAISSVLTSKKIFETLLNRAKNQVSIKDKLTGFQIALIIKLALMEGAGLVNVVLGMITQNSLFLIIAVAIAAFLYTQKPTESSIKEDLNLY